MQKAECKRQKAILVFCILHFAFCISAGAQAPVRDRFAGAWELVSFENIAADGSRRPGNYDRGQITYDASGRMSAQLMNSANKADQSPQTDEARAAAYRRYLGYYGPFVVDEAKGVITHIVEGSSNPSWIGSRQVRYYQFSADYQQLTLQVRDASGRVTGSLLWKRSK
ncbi:MAG TPA: lipocalin-like domain-containing protein [Vicinamibacterales bacterium]|nr:lipocalin-like domain-containing protein [Vicinamibacterales bacterium]